MLKALFDPLPKPVGNFQLLDGEVARPSIEDAVRFNRLLHRDHRELDGFEIVEVHPVILGGDPVALTNKRAVSPETHLELVRFWNSRLGQAAGSDAFAEAPGLPTDYEVFAAETENTVVVPPDGYMHVWSQEMSLAQVQEHSWPWIIGSDGSGSAFVADKDNDGGFVLLRVPFVPLTKTYATVTGRTLTDLIDSTRDEQ